MEMILKVKFSREVDDDIDFISPGGYQMSFSNGETIEFDFTRSVGRIDKDDKSIVNFRVSELDTDSFPESEFLSSFNGTVTEVQECFILTDTYNNSVTKPYIELVPIDILSCALINDNYDIIDIDKDVLDKICIDHI